MEPYILIVDDSSTMRRLMEMTLSNHGYLVEVASHGKHAWEKICNSAVVFDLVITDVHMPFMDGLQLKELIRQSTKFCEILLIALSGMEISTNGWDAVIRKPFPVSELPALVASTLENIGKIYGGNS